MNASMGITRELAVVAIQPPFLWNFFCDCSCDMTQNRYLCIVNSKDLFIVLIVDLMGSCGDVPALFKKTITRKDDR